MRLARHDGRLALVHGDSGAYLTEVTDGAFSEDVIEAITRWDELEERAQSLALDGFAVDPGRLSSPIPLPRQVFGIGMNYLDHAREAGLTDDQLPTFPPVFTKFPSSVTGPVATVSLPGPAVDFEAELLVVIKDEVEDAPETNAWRHVAGVMVGNDLSNRAVQLAGPVPQFSMGKSYRGFSPSGPAIVSVAELADPDALDLGCRIGEEILQSGNSHDLIFSVPELIAALSSIVRLLPGDVIWTGTPAGVGMGRKPQRMLAPGETLTTWVSGVGELTTHLVAGPTYAKEA